MTDDEFYLIFVIITGLIFLYLMSPTLFATLPSFSNISFGTIFLFSMLFVAIGVTIYIIDRYTRKYEHRRLLFKWMPTNSFVFGLIPFVIQNLLLFFAVSYQSELGPSAVYFYLFPLLFVMVLIIYLYLENKSESKVDLLNLVGLKITSGKMLILSIIIGLSIGSILFLIMSHTQSIVNTVVMPFSESISAKISMNQALANMNQRIIFYIVFFLLVGFGEELLCYFGLQVFSNFFYSRGMNKWYSIISGSLVSRSLWALEHWASWGSVGLFNVSNYVMAVTVGIMIFTVSGLLVFYRSSKRPVPEYLLITPWMAHFMYDLLVTLNLEGILQSILVSI